MRRLAVRFEGYPQGPQEPGFLFLQRLPCFAAQRSPRGLQAGVWRKLGSAGLPRWEGAAVSSRAGAGPRRGEARHVGGSARDACLAGAGAGPAAGSGDLFSSGSERDLRGEAGSSVCAAAVPRRRLPGLLARPAPLPAAPALVRAVGVRRAGRAGHWPRLSHHQIRCAPRASAQPPARPWVRVRGT